MKTTIVTATLVVFFGLWSRQVAACTGDCNTDAVVTVDEIIQGVNIALGSAAVTGCAAIDADASASVTVDEIVLAVNNGLLGCPTFNPGDYTASIELDDQVADIEFTVDEDGDITGELTLSPLTRSLSRGQAAGGASVTGSVNYATGQFSISGSIPGGLSFSVSGSLPSSRGGGSISITIGGRTYNGSFGGMPTATPTPTPPSGTVHNVKVGQSNLPFDPELIEINPGDTVTWMWVAGSGNHSVRSAVPGTCNPDGRFDSGAKTAGSFSYTFNTPGTYEYHCSVGTHCQNFETGIVIVRGTPTATATRTATRTATPPSTATATATADVVDGISRAILGIFSGQVTNDFGGTFPARFQIQQITGIGMVQVTDLSGFVLGQFGQLTLTAETPTRISYSLSDPFNTRSLTLELVGPEHMTGTFVTGSTGMGTFHLAIDLTREP